MLFTFHIVNYKLAVVNTFLEIFLLHTKNIIDKQKFIVYNAIREEVIPLELSTTEKIKILLSRKGMTMTQLAAATGQSRQNLSQKMERDNFGEKELRAIAAAIGCKYESTFVTENGERI